VPAGALCHFLVILTCWSFSNFNELDDYEQQRVDQDIPDCHPSEIMISIKKREWRRTVERRICIYTINHGHFNDFSNKVNNSGDSECETRVSVLLWISIMRTEGWQSALTRIYCRSATDNTTSTFVQKWRKLRKKLSGNWHHRLEKDLGHLHANRA
jgi:hypothetical protein